MEVNGRVGARSAAFGNCQEEECHAHLHHLHELDRAGIPQLEGCSQARRRGARSGQKMGVDIKHLYLTSGKTDLIAIVETASGDNVAKFCMVVGGQGNVRTNTVRGVARGRMHENDRRAALEHDLFGKPVSTPDHVRGVPFRVTL
jgi:uncharacterized protein with GYD domain